MLRSFSPLMRRTKILIIPPPQLHLLLPVTVVSDNQLADSLLKEVINQATAGRVQVGVSPFFPL
ncbi:hypothetical protein KSX_71580 [Ktedonospora formicarum]|uniref:Uncharacterized protein n=1 Tax=Ktedonospora formicarum TaxID=2778364 RepID=A0A8J3MXV2_9CHLR|nr:hypothetical protein KSX_71580 [Ktedonospora formicarum]